LWLVAVPGLAVVLWFDHLVRQAGRPDLVLLGASGVAYALAVLSAATVGGLLVFRRPGHPVGWLLLVLGASITFDGSVEGYAGYGALARPGALPGADLAAVYGSVDLLVARVCLGFLLR
jgi:hypothetical protein